VVRAFRGGALEMNRRLYRRPPRLGWLFARDLGRHWASAPVQQLVAELEAEDVPGIEPELLRQIRAPVLILWGEADGILPLSSVEFFRAHFGPASVEIVAGSGHLPMMERSAQVAARVSRFLKEL
jgi:pimeloyl-ACP methyl ester carboxylesterase